jgi:O-antigen ligase
MKVSLINKISGHIRPGSKMIIIMVMLVVISIGSILVANETINPTILFLGVIGCMVFIYKPILFFYAFVLIIPIEQLMIGSFLSLPKILGPFAFLAWFVEWIKHRRSIRWDATLTIMCFFMLWALLSLLWTVDRDQSMQLLVTYSLLAVLYFLIINIVQTKKELVSFIWALWVGGLILVASGIYQLLSGEVNIQSGNPLAGFAVNANAYVLYGILVIPSLLYLTKVNRLMKIFNIVILLALLITSFYTLSRGGIISIAAFGAALLFFRTSRRSWLPVLLLALVFILQLAPSELWERFNLIGSERNDRISVLWPAGFTFLTQNPLFGSGVGTDTLVIGKIFSKDELSVHSAPLAIAIELGLPGLFLYLGFIIIPIFHLWKTILARRRLENMNLLFLAIFLFAGIVAFMVSWLKGGGLEYNKILWVNLGLASALSQLPPSVRQDQAGMQILPKVR